MAIEFQLSNVSVQELLFFSDAYLCFGQPRVWKPALKRRILFPGVAGHQGLHCLLVLLCSEWAGYRFQLCKSISFVSHSMLLLYPFVPCLLPVKVTEQRFGACTEVERDWIESTLIYNHNTNMYKKSKDPQWSLCFHFSSPYLQTQTQQLGFRQRCNWP